MKRIDLKIFIVSVLVLAIACSIGAASVSALTEDGENLLDELMSAGSSAGVDINGFIDNFVTTTDKNDSEDKPADENAVEDLEDIVATIGIGADVLVVTDLVAYLNRGGSFADWIYDNYGDQIVVPDSVKTMSNKDLAIFFMNKVLYPDQTQAEKETTSKYIYSDDNDSDQPTDNDDTIVPETSTVEKATDKTNANVPGDIDGDGKVRAMDARLALRASASLDVLEGAAFDAADINGDGRITANDARSILRYAAGLINSL